MDVVCARRSRGLGFIVAALSAIFASGAHAQETVSAPWSMTNIGSPTPNGTATHTNGVFTVTGSGSGIGSTSDQLQFVYQAVTGDTEIVTRVDNLVPADPDSKVGVMVRRTLTGSSSFAFTYVSGGRGLGVASRRTDGRAQADEVASSTTVAPAWLKVRRAGSTVFVSRSSDGVTWTEFASRRVTLDQTAYIGLAVAAHSTTQMAMADLSRVAITGGTQVPVLRSADIGSPQLAGTATLSSGVYTVRGSGFGINSTSDQFQFAYQQATGDIDIRARVDSFSDTAVGTRAGVMVRESLGSASAHVVTLNRPAGAFEFRRRLSTGAGTASTASGTAGPGRWVRLVRRSNRFDSYHSTDGQSWTLIGTADVPMASTVLVGLAVTSTNSSSSTTAGLSNISIVSAPPAPNQVPTVALTAPTAAQSFTAPATIDVAASASDSDGTIARVEFYADATLIATDTSAPYAASWTSVAVGSYSLTAVAVDNAGGRATSAPFALTVAAANQAPSVSLTSPTVGQSFTTPASIALAAVATDPENRLSRVEFRANGALLVSDTAAPFAFTWSAVAAGTYSLTAVAFDQDGAQATSTAVSVPVAAPNQPPTVTLTSPVNGQSATAPAMFTLAANASDPEGRLARVEFYVNGALRGTDTAAPFTADWSNVPAGSYQLHAVAFDAEGDRSTSPTATVTVSAIASPTFTVAFTASADHATNVTGYRLDVFTAGADVATAAPLATSDLGKPTPDAQSTITVDRSAFIAGLPAGSYLATVTALGPGGSTRSLAIPFTRPGTTANQVPTVALTAPVNGQTAVAPANVALAATASDSDGTIARVEFYAGATLIGTDTAAPYTVSWSSVGQGSYSVTAVAIDDAGGRSTSPAVVITVTAPNQPPSVSLTSPTAGQSFTAPASIALAATASDPENRLSRVEFRSNGSLLVSDTSAPFTFTWSPVSAGTYAITAVAFDQDGAQATSTAVSVSVAAANEAPSVSLTAPTVGQSFTAPASIALAAVATDPENRLSRVEFRANGALLVSDTAAPFAFTWSAVAAGTYSLTAVAFDQDGAQATSTAVSVAVSAPNQPPTVTLTSPVSGQPATAPAMFTLAANASDPEGRLARVEFYVNGALRGTDTAAPFTADWSNVPAGSYQVHAVAVDADGAVATSPTATVTVNAVVNPTFTVAFTASGDHATNVDGYRLDVFAAGANVTTATPVATSDLAKPTPDAQSTIAVDRTAFIAGLPAGGYQATVTALGPGGSTRSLAIAFTR